MVSYRVYSTWLSRSRYPNISERQQALEAHVHTHTCTSKKVSAHVLRDELIALWGYEVKSKASIHVFIKICFWFC